MAIYTDNWGNHGSNLEIKNKRKNTKIYRTLDKLYGYANDSNESRLENVPFF